MADKKKKNISKDLAVRIIRDSAVWNYLPPASSVVSAGPRGLKIYDDMKKDPRINSLFFERVNATHNRACYLSAVEDDRITSYADDHLSEKHLRLWAYKLLRGALTYGFQPAEVIWEKDAKGYWYIDSLALHDITRYSFDREGTLNYGMVGKLDQPYKWIIHRIDGDSQDNIYGTSILDCVYWAWTFKRLGVEFWLKATEKFSSPSIVAIFEQSDGKKARQTAEELADLVSSITAGSGGALANVKDLKQITMGGSVADFDTLINAMDLQISYGMTAQALANNISTTGTQALGTVQAETKGDFWENDARALAYTMQKLVDWCIELNFGSEAEAPEFEFDTDVKASFSEVMQAVEKGIKVSRKAMYSQYGLPEPENEEDVLEVTPASAGPAWPQGGAFNFSDSPDEGKKKRPVIVIHRD